MSERKINLNKILSKYNLNSDEIGIVTNLLIKETMLEFGKQLLELAAENAKGKPFPMNETGVIRYSEINKQSILDTINQVK